MSVLLQHPMYLLFLLLPVAAWSGWLIGRHASARYCEFDDSRTRIAPERPS